MPLLRVQQVLENLKLKSQNLKLHVKCQIFLEFNPPAGGQDHSRSRHP